MPPLTPRSMRRCCGCLPCRDIFCPHGPSACLLMCHRRP
uniref:Uncharacterized protein n=1 Tax=Triticum urartu TaxID=4572 RepID=A0A8R7UER7_TRIUA